MAGKLTINDLTKEELLELIIYRGLNHSINIRDIERVRWNTMIRKAKKMAEEACAEMEAHTGPENWPTYKKAADKFDRAMELYAESDKFIASN